MARILVVDDDDAYRRIVQLGLEHAGHRVRTASDGAAGLTAMKAEVPDLVVSDILMPVMDGFELLRRVRADPRLAGTPLIFMSGTYGPEEAKLLAQAGGASQILAKPVRTEELLSVVAGLLRDHAERAALPTPEEIEREHLRVLAAKLQAKVAELESTQAALRESESQLRALSTRLLAVREEEAMRIARELHDELGQALTGLKFTVAALQMTALPDAIAVRVAGMRSELDALMATTRRLCTELRPGVLDQLGLIPALEWQAQEFEGRTGVLCDLHFPAAVPDCPAECATTVFRIFQELLTNIARHADASAVSVELTSAPSEIALTVRDDGRGFTPSEVEGNGGLGSLGMRERARAAGGILTLTSAPGQGTQAILRIDLLRE